MSHPPYKTLDDSKPHPYYNQNVIKSVERLPTFNSLDRKLGLYKKSEDKDVVRIPSARFESEPRNMVSI